VPVVVFHDLASAVYPVRMIPDCRFEGSPFDPTVRARAMAAMLKMKKLDISALQRACDGR
jgi:hypothetical protein